MSFHCESLEQRRFLSASPVEVDPGNGGGVDNPDFLTLNEGQIHSLLVKAERAREAFGRGNAEAAQGILDALSNQAEAFRQAGFNVPRGIDDADIQPPPR